MTTDKPAPGPLAVAAPWDLVSAGYSAEAMDIMLPFSQLAIELAQPSAEADVLDVATGPGVLALELAPRVRRVDAIDFSPRMLAELEQRRQSVGVSNVFAQVADGQNLPFVDGSFDVAFSMFGLMFFPDRARGFAELYRTLKPGGLAVVSSWAPVDQSSLMILMFGALRAADATRAAPQTNLLNLENPEVFARELKQAGFRDVRVEPHTCSLEVSDPAAWWESMVRGGAHFALLKQRLGPLEWERQAQLAKAYLAEQIPGPRTLSTTAYFGFGRR